MASKTGDLVFSMLVVVTEYLCWKLKIASCKSSCTHDQKPYHKHHLKILLHNSFGSAHLSNPFKMQTQAVCASAKQHGPISEVQNSWHCSLALSPLPFSPHIHTKGLVGTGSNLAPGWTQYKAQHPHVPVPHRTRPRSPPNPSAARSKAQ